MSKWLQAARSARASKPDPGLSTPVPIVPIVPIAPQTRPNGTNGTNGTEAESLIRRARLAVVPDMSDPEDIQVWLIERAAMREDSGAVRVDADKAAFDELLWLWCAANPIEHAPGRCAACGTAVEPPTMTLPDGAQVCDRADHPCLIAYGNGRRMTAVTALDVMGITPPAWWGL